jgi:hypothetical protein
MTQPSGRDVSSATMPPASSRALWTAIFCHLLVLAAAATGSIPPSTAVVAGIGCSIIAVAALTELATPALRRAVTALIGGHAVAAIAMLGGFAPSIPWSLPLTGLAAAAALDIVSLVTATRAVTANCQPQPLTMAPRVAAIALVVEALLQHWAESTTGLSMLHRAAVLSCLAALGVAVLASFSIIALRVRPRWAIAGLLAWMVGWVAITADLGSLIVWSLGGSFPTAPHQRRLLDAELVQILATAGGLAIGAALVTSIHEARFRHSAVALLAGYALFGLFAAIAEHRIGLATDFPGVTALRKDRDLAGTIRALPLAGVLWLYWRQVAVAQLRRRRAEEDDDPLPLLP